MMTRAANSARWFLFAVRADDARRATYRRWLSRLHAGEVAARRRAAETLAGSAVGIPTSVGHWSSAQPPLDGIDAVVADVHRRRARATRTEQSVKPYLHHFPLTGLDLTSPLLRFALSEPVLGAAATYLGMVPVLTMVTMLESGGTAAALSGSQLFHSDWEDQRQVKVFVHCTDVAAANGPLTAVTADASTRVKRAVGYRYGGPEFRLADDTVLPRVRADEVTAFAGPTGAATFIDTSSCLHFGSRVEPGADARLVVQFQYLTPTAFDLVRRGRAGRPFASVAGQLTPAQRLALGATR